MKIVIIGSKNDDSLEFHLEDTLIRMGNDVIVLDDRKFKGRLNDLHMFARRVFIKQEEIIFLKLAKKTIDFKPDLVIVTIRYISPLFVKMIKEHKIKIIHINPDAITTFVRGEYFAEPFDAYFTKDHYICRFMQDKLNLNTFYLPEAFNPYYHIKSDIDKNLMEEKIKIDVLTMGTMYYYRYAFIKKIIEAGISVDIFGVKPKYIKDIEFNNHFTNEYITGTRKSELIYGAKIVLNNMHYAEIEAVNCKFFEIQGMGGVQLCDYKPVMQEFAEPGKEILTFNSVDECIDKIKYFLPRTEERIRIAQNAYNRAIKEHSYETRIKEIFNRL